MQSAREGMLGEATMKSITCLVAATVAVVFAAPSPAQVDCADWNTEAFFKAAEASDVTRCLQAGAGLEVRDEHGRTPLRLAAQVGNVEAIRILANAGADPNTRSNSYETPLLAAAVGGAVETVTALLQAGANPNAREPRDGTTLLHTAAAVGTAEILAVLLEAGADPNARDRDGTTPLHTAAAVGTAEVLAVLLEAGANPNALDRNRKTPWDRARDRKELKGSDVYLRLASAASAHPQLDCTGWNTTAFFEASEASEVARCVESGADLNARSAGGWTPLHMAALYSQPAVIKTLLEVGADPNARSKDGRAPLHMALGYDKYKKEDHNRDFEVVAALLEAGADPNARNSGRWTPLHSAADTGQLPVIQALLVAGGDPNVRSGDGRTPLHIAVHSMHPKTPEVVTELLNSGADPNARNEAGKSPWDLAQRNRKLKNTDAYRRLAASAAGCPRWNNISWFETAELEEIQICLAAGVDPNAIGAGGWTPLHMVVARGKHPDIVMALLKAGADPNARLRLRRETPLHFAALSYPPGLSGMWPSLGAEVIKLLFQAGADIESRSLAGRTPLHFAVEGYHPYEIMALLEAGAKPDARDGFGETPLDLAQRNRALQGTGVYLHMIRALVRSGGK